MHGYGQGDGGVYGAEETGLAGVNGCPACRTVLGSGEKFVGWKGGIPIKKEQEKGRDKRIQRVGIIGTGRIASRFIPETEFVNGICVQGVYNPHKESARQFAAKWRIQAYEDLTEFFHGIDVVYVASPHETHYFYIKAALEQGKHVLCEKPLVLERKQAEELFAYAGKNRLVLLEGIKTAYCPGFRKLLEIADSGIIGTIRYVDACFTKLEAWNSRELTDRVYGGSFTELGSYCLLPVIKLLGNGFEELRFESIRRDNGLDIFTKASFRYPEGLATVTCGLGVKADGRLMAAGTKGYIIAKAPWWKTTNLEVHYENPLEVEKYQEVFLGDGLRYEIRAFLDQVNGRGEADQVQDDRDFCGFRGFRGYGLTPGESVVLADIMGRFLSMERCVEEQGGMEGRYL